MKFHYLLNSFIIMSEALIKIQENVVVDVVYDVLNRRGSIITFIMLPDKKLSFL